MNNEVKSVPMPIDDTEMQIWNKINEATRLFASLPDHHPAAKSEWCFYIHGLQGLMEHRICKRLYPNFFR